MNAPKLLAAAALLVPGLASAHKHLPHPDKVVVVILENHNFDDIVGVPEAAFINDELIRGGLLFTDAHGTQHPSQPNYPDLFSGSTQGVNNANAAPTNTSDLNFLAARIQAAIANPATPPAQIPALEATLAQILGALAAGFDPKIATGDAFPTPTNFLDFQGKPVQVPFSAPNLASELRRAGHTFVEYAEGLAAAGCADADGIAVLAQVNDPKDPHSVGYAHRHDPVADWLVDGHARGDQLPLSVEQDFANFDAQGRSFRHLPDVSFVVPNTIDDMHDGAIPASTLTGDAWLRANLSNYLAWARRHHSLLVVTTDESDFDATNHIATIVNGDPDLFEAGTSDQHISHFEVLSTLESMFDAGHAGASQFAMDFASRHGRFVATNPDHPRHDDDGDDDHDE